MAAAADVVPGLGPALTGGLIGAVGGVGLLLVVTRLRAMRVTLDMRLAPYLRRHSSVSALLRDPVVHTPFPTLERLVAPVMADAVRVVERLTSPAAETRRRLVRSGTGTSLEQYRAEQVVWAVLGLVCGLLVALLGAAGGRLPVPVAVLVVAIGGLGGVAGREYALSRTIGAREDRILTEFPTVVEMLALAVTAGEGPLGALERVARRTGGELSAELDSTLAEIRSGVPFTTAMDRMAQRTGVVGVGRFAEAVAVAVERGTPLAEVLRAQAQDAREDGRRALMEAGGKKEIAMMVPVVFLVLPVTVVFALFPGASVLQIGL